MELNKKLFNFYVRYLHFRKYETKTRQNSYHK